MFRIFSKTRKSVGLFEAIPSPDLPGEIQESSSSFAVIIPVWNEETALNLKFREIRRLNPSLIIFSHGCFDLNFPADSEDGSLSKLLKFAEDSQTPCFIVNAVRDSKAQNILNLCRAGISKSVLPFPLERTLMLRLSNYRLNQASTLNECVRIARSRQIPWVYITDVDELLPNRVINKVRDALKQTFHTILFDETTIFGLQPPQYAPHYYAGVWKTWNGFYKNNRSFFLIPTREPRRASRSGLFSHQLKKSPEVLQLGPIFHLKIEDPWREKLRYSVGERRPLLRDATILRTLPEALEKDLQDATAGPAATSTSILR